MKQLVITTAALLLMFSGHAQLGRLANKVKNKVAQRADAKEDKAIDKALDALEGKNMEQENQTTAVPSGDTSKAPAPLASYSRYDFVPGERILYAEDFDAEAIGELATGWNTNGSGEVVTLEGQSSKWMRLHKSFVYLSSNTREFGTDYTLEFDLVMDLKNNGWLFPTIQFGVLSSGNVPNADNSLLKNYGQYGSVAAVIHPGTGVSRLTMESLLEGRNYFTGNVKEYNDLEKYYSKPVHVSIQVQKERCRIWINEVKAFDAPKAVPQAVKMNQLFFSISHTNYAEEQYALYVSNIKIATGLPDTRHKLAEEGKFSTTGILFDVNQATIKPESYGVLKEIAGVIKQADGMRILITGHTSSDGDDKMNLDLSRRRAAAVKQALVSEYGIDAAMLDTDGKGETEPVADNKTKEGKAANRRVEFKKL